MHGIDADDEIVYWRERAKRAEAQLAAVTGARDRLYEIAKGTFALHLMTTELADEMDDLRNVGKESK